MTPELQHNVDRLVAAIGRCSRPVIVAIDGPSGAGKTMVAAGAAPLVGATLISTDDFFAATIPDAEWEVRTPAQRAADAIDWRRLRTEVIEPLQAGHRAQWRGFDFVAGPRPDGTFEFRHDPTVAHPSAVLILEGTYSARPELADLIDLAVLVTAAESTRRARLAAREDPGALAAWHARWDDAEAHYFQQLRPPATFALTLTLTTDHPPRHRSRPVASALPTYYT